MLPAAQRKTTTNTGCLSVFFYTTRALFLQLESQSDIRALRSAAAFAKCSAIQKAQAEEHRLRAAQEALEDRRCVFSSFLHSSCTTSDPLPLSVCSYLLPIEDLVRNPEGCWGFFSPPAFSVFFFLHKQLHCEKCRPPSIKATRVFKFWLHFVPQSGCGDELPEVHGFGERRHRRQGTEPSQPRGAREPGNRLVLVSFARQQWP